MNIALDSHLKNQLVEEAEEISEKLRNRPNQASQLRNMIQICQTESELLVLENFIRYQAARSGEPKKFWNDIHEDVIEVLRKIAHDVAFDDVEKRRVAMQSFFGYLMRSYVYKTSGVGRSQAKHRTKGKS